MSWSSRSRPTRIVSCFSSGVASGLGAGLPEADPDAAAGGADGSAQQEGTFGCLADHLRVRVTQDGLTKVSLTFPAMAVDNLVTLMGEDVARRMRAKWTDLTDIIRDVRHSSYKPQELFCLQEVDRARAVRVWLE